MKGLFGEADMAVHLRHMNSLAEDLEATIAFYVEAPSLAKGERPPFSFAGAPGSTTAHGPRSISRSAAHPGAKRIGRS